MISHAVRQPVFLRSMSAPSDLEMIGNEDIEFARASQRYSRVESFPLHLCVVQMINLIKFIPASTAGFVLVGSASCCQV